MTLTTLEQEQLDEISRLRADYDRERLESITRLKAEYQAALRDELAILKQTLHEDVQAVQEWLD